MFKIQGELPYNHLCTLLFRSGKDAKPEGTTQYTVPSQAPGGQAVVPRRLGYKNKSRKWHACSPSHYGQATCEDTAVSSVHSIKITAIMQVVKTPKPSTCCKRSHRVGFRDRRGTASPQSENKGKKHQAKSKSCPRCEEMLFEATGSLGGHHTPNWPYNAYKGVL